MTSGVYDAAACGDPDVLGDNQSLQAPRGPGLAPIRPNFSGIFPCLNRIESICAATPHGLQLLVDWLTWNAKDTRPR